MQTISTLINARWVLPIAPENAILENHAIAVNGNKIIDVCPIDNAKQRYSAQTVIDRLSHVVMPGLVNTHCHSAMALVRGLADDLPLMDWLNNHIWPAESKTVSAEMVKDGTRLALAEMLRGGTTCYNDHYFFPLETAEVTIEAGMRGCIGLQVMNVPNSWAQDTDGYLAKAREAYQNRQQSDLIRWVVAPHAPYTNSDESLLKAKAMADEFGLRMHVHMHETEAELAMDLEKYGKRPIQRFDDLGLLDDRFIAVHMVHVSDEEIALCAKRGVHIAHCPESNLKLASGEPQVERYRAAGINVSLGTDGAASNNDLDMFGEMRTASFLAKQLTRNPTTLPASEVIKMATLNGAKALGLDEQIGSLEVGKQADMIAINMDHLFTQPIYNPMSHIVYAMNRLQVQDVWVAGRQLLCNGEFTTLDLKVILERARYWAEQCLPYGLESG
jgi:5-methylthioadenosine/S-adenosylhomocysteine deaminase